MEKIFIVEDDENIRELVIYALKSSGFEALGFENGNDFFQYLKNNNLPTLVLLDIMLPGEDGLSILKKIRQSNNTVPVIMLTAKGSEFDKVTGLDAGADDYITKPFGILELISRINAVLRRTGDSSVKDKNKLSYKNISLDNEKHIVTVNNEKVPLTLKEYDLLQYLLINTDIVISRDRILDEVWGYNFEGESRTVDMHIKTLRQKLKDAGENIKTIRGVGYKIGE